MRRFTLAASAYAARIVGGDGYLMGWDVVNGDGDTVCSNPFVWDGNPRDRVRLTATELASWRCIADSVETRFMEGLRLRDFDYRRMRQ